MECKQLRSAPKREIAKVKWALKLKASIRKLTIHIQNRIISSTYRPKLTWRTPPQLNHLIIRILCRANPSRLVRERNSLTRSRRGCSPHGIISTDSCTLKTKRMLEWYQWRSSKWHCSIQTLSYRGKTYQPSSFNMELAKMITSPR